MRKGKIVISNFPHPDGFMEWAGLKGKGLYVDAEMLMGKHDKYFKDQVHALAAVDFVLNAPEKANDIGKNFSFVRYDKESGQYFRIEIKKDISGNLNHVRSAHILNGENQYKKAKAGISSPVLQLSLAGANSVQSAMSYSDFVRKYTAKYPNVKFSIKENQENLRFSIAPVIEIEKQYQNPKALMMTAWGSFGVNLKRNSSFLMKMLKV